MGTVSSKMREPSLADLKQFRTNTKEFCTRNMMSATRLAAGTTQGLLQNPGEFHFILQKEVVNTVGGQPLQGTVLTLQRGNQGDADTIRGYWVPQGKSCEIPENPTDGPHYVFTPDFSGCQLMVDKLNNGGYKVYHVEGGKEQAQYIGLARDGHELAGAFVLEDYRKKERPLDTRAFAFLKYESEEKRWWIYYQCHSGGQLGIKENSPPISITPQALRGGGRVPIEKWNESGAGRKIEVESTVLHDHPSGDISGATHPEVEKW